MTLTEYDWPTIRDDANRRLGDTPPADIETRILDVFRTHPQHVVAAIDRAALSAAAGMIRYPWSLVAKIAENAAAPAERVRAVDGTDRGRRVANAVAWIVNAGCHYDRWDEVHDALFVEGFGDKGQTLRPWATEQPLLEEMRNEWERRRPAAVASEHAAEARAAKYLADQWRIRQQAADRRAALDAAQAAAHADPDPEPTPRPKAAAT